MSGIEMMISLMITVWLI